MQFDPATHRAMQVAFEAPRPSGSARWLHLLSALLQLAGGKAELIRHSERAWASATFSGARHTVLLSFSETDGISAGEAFIDTVPEHEFTLPHCLVADASVIAVEQTALPAPRLTVEIELLLLDDV